MLLMRDMMGEKLAFFAATLASFKFVVYWIEKGNERSKTDFHRDRHRVV